MAEHKKPARPKAEEATKKPQAEEQSPTADVKEEAAQPTPTPKTAAPVAAAAKPAKPSKSETAPAEAPRENLSLDADDVEKPKIVKAKGAKNIHSGIAHV